MVRKPPPSGGGGGDAAVIRAILSPAAHFGWLWGPQIKSQKSKQDGNTNMSWGAVIRNKFHPMKSNTKFIKIT